MNRADRRSTSLLCLAPPGVFPASDFTAEPVGSYPAISPLPSTTFGPTHQVLAFSGPKMVLGGIFSVTLSVD